MRPRLPGNDARGEFLRPSLGDGRRFGQAQHLDRARAIGEPPDEAALLQRHDQPMNAGLGAQIERLLHFVEGRRHALVLQALVNETKQLALLPGQHGSLPNGAARINGSERLDAKIAAKRKQIANMCLYVRFAFRKRVQSFQNGLTREICKPI